MCLIQFFDSHSGAITAITAVLLAVLTGIYVWLTSRLVKIQRQEIMQPMIGFNLSIEAQGHDFLTHVHVTNNSRFFCQVWTNLHMHIYGRLHRVSARYEGSEPWNILPGGTIVGWFSVEEILRQNNRDLQEVIRDTQTGIGNKITIDVEIRAEGLPGEAVTYPPLHWYLELSERRVAWVYMS